LISGSPSSPPPVEMPVAHSRPPQGPLTVEQAVAQLDELADKTAKEAYALSLPDELRTRLVQALQDRKAAVAKAQLQGLLD
jgi:hypothetical protein